MILNLIIECKVTQKAATTTTIQMVFRNIYGNNDSAMAIFSVFPTSTNLSPE